jgi:tRNA(Ile)-lysidine synthase
MITQRLIAHLRRQFAAHLQPDQPVLVAVSGGADSLALLHLCIALRQPVVAATLDHGLRGEQGADDARCVEALAAEWGAPCVRGAVDARRLAHDWRMGIEAAARCARYDFLADAARQRGIGVIVTAHHADDQAETVLMRLLRGTGIDGLAAMEPISPVPGHDDLKLLRPLLAIPKADLSAYCVEHGIQPREDATNADTDYLRNRVRLEVLPALRVVSPQIDRHLTRLADIARHENDLIAAELESWAGKSAAIEPGRVTMARNMFLSAPTALRRRFIVWGARRIAPDNEIDYEHVLRAVDAAERGAHGAIIQLGGGAQLRIAYDQLYIEHESAPMQTDLPLLPSLEPIPLTAPVALLNGWQAGIDPAPPPDSRCFPLALPSDAVVALRGRRRGERFHPLGVDGTTSVSDWMIDRKIPRQLRDRVPILTVDDQIACILWLDSPGRDRHFVSEDPNTCIYLRKIEEV